MSERLPYEQHLHQQWNNLPLPDEQAAWDDMARRLEEDDDDKGIFFWWRTGCGVWALLLLLFAVGWWIVRPEKYFSNKNNKIDSAASVTIHPQQYGYNQQENLHPKANGDTNAPSPAETERQHVSGHGNDANNVSEDDRHPSSNDRISNQRVVNPNNGQAAATRGRRTQPGDRRTMRTRAQERSIADDLDQPTEGNVSVITANNMETSLLLPSLPATVPAFDATIKRPPVKGPEMPVDSSLAKKAADEDSSQSSKAFPSFGIAIHQLIPVAGQQATPYNALGREGSLGDYIPSVYVRLNKPDKWFVQAAFRYGAPQNVKEFTYHQESIPDTGVSPRFVTNSSARLKKTFYHQLPLSFNYYVLPNWSVGTGVVWNKFYAAITDQETIKHDNFTNGDSVLFKGIVSIKNDTSGTFAKSFFQGIVETQYQWKRLSIGARYAFGLQPYIRFTLPGMEEQKESNRSLQVFLRLELWRPKKHRW